MPAESYLSSAPFDVQPILRRALTEETADASDAAREAMRHVGFPLWKDTDPTPPRTLDDAQRAVAGALAFRRDLKLSPFAVPWRACVRRRWLAIDPPGVLEEDVGPPGDPTPRWARYAQLVRDGELAKIGADLDDDPARKTEALVEFALGSYSAPNLAVTLPLGVLIDEHASKLVVYARRLGRDLMGLDVDGRGTPTLDPLAAEDVTAWSAAYLPLAVAGEPFDATLLPLVTFGGVTPARAADVVGWFPEARRDELAVYALRRSIAYAVPTGCAILARYPLPGLAAYVVEKYAGGKADGQTPPAVREGWKRMLEDLATNHPDVAPWITAALSPATRTALGLAAPRKAPAPKKPKWTTPPENASIEDRLRSFEDAIERNLPRPDHAFLKALDALLLDVFGRAWRPVPLRRPASLTDVERRALVVFAQAAPAMSPFLAHAGIPHARRIVGIDPSDLVDAMIEVAGEHLPAWCALADVVYSDAPFDPAARAVAALPEAQKIWIDLARGRGPVTMAPLTTNRPKVVTDVVPLPLPGPRLVRFLGVLGAMIGAPVVDYCRKRLLAQLEEAHPSVGALLLDVIVLTRVGESEPRVASAVALLETRLGPDLLACLHEVQRPAPT